MQPILRRATVLVGLAMGAALAAMLVLPFGGAGQAAAKPDSAAAFETFELSAVAGTTCPGSRACFNGASEPQIRADKAGNFYASSENGLGGGTLAWKSTDGGRHFTALASPNALSATAATGLAPGGGDTDVAVATEKNGQGFYNAYVASLSLANVDVSTSTDGGRTWELNPTSATVPGDDREWIAADGTSKVCISYHDVVTFNINVACSLDAGATFLQPADAIDAQHAWLIDNNAIGNLAIDPASHVIYQIFSGVANASEDATSTVGATNYHAVWIGVSTDGGNTFVEHAVYINPDVTASYGHQFVNVSVDKAGNVYAVFTDNHNVYYNFSTDHGTTWSAPVQINQAPSNTAIMPWSVAGDAGKLDVVWYGTSFYDGQNPPDAYPVTAAWYVYFAQNLNAAQPGSAFTQVAATPIIHYGGVCEGGVSCTGNRDLFDDFGVAADPLTGFASIVYSDDQYIADANNPAGPRCKPAQTNAPSCDHTSIATQTSGEGIFATEAQKQPKKSAPDGAAPAAAPATAQSAPQSASSGNPSVSGTIGPAVSDVGGTIDQVAVAADGAANTATTSANSATNTATNTAASAANTATNTVNSAVATVAPRTGGVNLP